MGGKRAPSTSAESGNEDWSSLQAIGDKGNNKNKTQKILHQQQMQVQQSNIPLSNTASPLVTPITHPITSTLVHQNNTVPLSGSTDSPLVIPVTSHPVGQNTAAALASSTDSPLVIPTTQPSTLNQLIHGTHPQQSLQMQKTTHHPLASSSLTNINKSADSITSQHSSHLNTSTPLAHQYSLHTSQPSPKNEKPIVIRSRSNSRSEDPIERTDENVNLLRKIQQQLNSVPLEVNNTTNSLQKYPTPGTFKEVLSIYQLDQYLNNFEFHNRSEWMLHIMAHVTKLRDVGYGKMNVNCTFIIEPTHIQPPSQQDFQ